MPMASSSSRRRSGSSHDQYVGAAEALRNTTVSPDDSASPWLAASAQVLSRGRPTTLAAGAARATAVASARWSRPSATQAITSRSTPGCSRNRLRIQPTVFPGAP